MFELDQNCSDDLLGRSKDVTYLKKFILNHYTKNPKNCMVLNINASWGLGKTCLLKTLYNQLENDEIKCMYYDAWTHDISKDPMASFTGCFHKTFNSSSIERISNASKKVVTGSMKIIAKALTKKYLGLSKEELEELSGLPIETGEITSTINSYIDKFGKETNDYLELIKQMKIQLESIAKELKDKDEKSAPLIIFIDELDRCRPTFAIELLEIIKHIFSAEGVYFILGTDTKQLQESLKVIYGDTFNTQDYLKRFFDLEYTLTLPPIDAYIQGFYESFIIQPTIKLHNPFSSGSTHGTNPISNVEILSLLSKSFDLSIRDINQVLTYLDIVISSFESQSRVLNIHFVWLAFLIIARHKNRPLYDYFHHITLGTYDTSVENKLKDELKDFHSILRQTRKDNFMQNRTSLFDLINFFAHANAQKYSSIKNPQNYVINAIVVIEKNNRGFGPQAYFDDGFILFDSLPSYFDRINQAGHFFTDGI